MRYEFYCRRHEGYLLFDTESAWLHYKHPDGQWVTMRAATPDDYVVLTALLIADTERLKAESLAKQEDAFQAGHNAASPKDWILVPERWLRYRATLEEEPQARATRYAWEVLDLKTDMADLKRVVEGLRAALQDVLASDPHNCSDPTCHHCAAINIATNYLRGLDQ